jgi:hypothetical protein
VKTSLFEIQILGPRQRFINSETGWGQEFAFLRSTQGIKMLLFGDHTFEKHWSKSLISTF